MRKCKEIKYSCSGQSKDGPNVITKVPETFSRRLISFGKLFFFFLFSMHLLPSFFLPFSCLFNFMFFCMLNIAILLYVKLSRVMVSSSRFGNVELSCFSAQSFILIIK